MPPGTEPTLYAFSGLPGTGKSTLAQGLAARLGAVYLRIDTLEQRLRDAFPGPIEAEGYELAYAIAADNLRLGLSVVADCVNPVEATRAAWAQTARTAGARIVPIGVTCNDAGEHRRRVEGRVADIPGLRLPTWKQVLDREFQPWATQEVFIDTGEKRAQACLEELLLKLHNYSQV